MARAFTAAGTAAAPAVLGGHPWHCCIAKGKAFTGQLPLGVGTSCADRAGPADPGVWKYFGEERKVVSSR